MEPELECFDAQTHKADGFGELKDGFVLQCSLQMSRLYARFLLLFLCCSLHFSPRLLDPKHFLLPLLGSRFPLEAAVGINGKVWVSTKETKHTIAIVRCIEAVDTDGGGMDETNVKKFLGKLDI
jgi:exosome complex component RRP40